MSMMPLCSHLNPPTLSNSSLLVLLIWKKHAGAGDHNDVDDADAAGGHDDKEIEENLGNVNNDKILEM